jgi:endoglucanase
MNFDLLKRLCETPGVPGREERVRELVAAELAPLVDDITVDVMGNLIAHKRGRGGPKVMIAAHMDEIGFIVKFIDSQGFVKLQQLGGWDPRVMVAQRVYVHGHTGQTLLGALLPATKSLPQQSPEERNSAPKISDFYVDLGLTGEQVKELVEVGDMLTMARTTEQIGDCVISKSLDDRIGVFVMIEAVRACRNSSADILAVATTQEEVGCRGATTAAHALNPDVGVALDVTLAQDVPGAPDAEQITQLGKGCALKIMDSYSISHPKLMRHFRDLAAQHDIPYQLEVLPFGGTDAGSIQKTQSGVPAITISIPTRYVHTVNEMAHTRDVEGAITLLARYLEDSHNREYRR